MAEQKVLFMSGFPRAGTTLLMNILAQNPKFHGTPTSGLIGSVVNLRDNWRNSDIYKSNREEYIYPKIRGLIKGMIEGFYEEQINNNQIPIDKNRTWTGLLDLLDEIMGTRVKIIFPVRHIVDCCISMELKNRKGALTNHGDNGNWLNEQSTKGRAENFIKDDGVFGLPLLYLREAIYRHQTDRIIVVPYDDLLTYPKQTLDKMYEQLGLEKFEHNTHDIKQTIVEDDLMHGFAPGSLHKIKEGALLPPNDRNMTVFDKQYMDNIEKERFGDITQFINNHSITNKR
jgi:sulfotransferase